MLRLFPPSRRFWAAIGGLTSVFASWLTQQTQAKAQWVAQERARRQKLYKDFIELRDMLNSGQINLLREFSNACRAEFDSLRARQF